MEQIQAKDFAHSMEIRALTAHLPSGDLPGYQIRFLVEDSGSPGTQEPKWGPWLFLPEALAVQMVDHMQKYFSTEGHLSPKAIPSGRVQ